MLVLKVVGTVIVIVIEFVIKTAILTLNPDTDTDRTGNRQNSP